MANNTEKLIRQLAFASYLVAKRRPVTAPEICSEVEDCSVINQDAFAQRLFSDRSALEWPLIVLSIEKLIGGLGVGNNERRPTPEHPDRWAPAPAARAGVQAAVLYAGG